MGYDLNPQRLVIFSGFFGTISWVTARDYFELSTFYGILLLTLWGILLIGTRFKFKINDDHFVYRILFYNKLIFKKEIYPDQIEQLRFIRVGWAKKAAIIKIYRGKNIRLAVITQPNAYEHLLEFAEKHDISIFKTKDYLILERMK
ncbi:hypothetical protein [Oceanobacillus chungangensis]|uniref:PH domain-containing protein n=1 Tax=Oceanobacillus chungangensis TaxID=1229152 RepID=A0A3D8PIF5_9BACI|nr:hypothetical protein [Oceanobacillus chungangensis]RDW15880.1 hypothetical protein CWR45_16145 [Oceanobacillus chungangensis]